MTPVAATTLERARQLRLRGFAHNTAGRPQQAARSLRAALQLLPPLPEAATREVDVVRVACLLTLAVCDLATVGLPAALARLEDARRIAGDDAELAARCRCQRGFLLGRGGDLARAEADLAVVLEQPHWFTPAERASTLLNRGMVHVELGRPAAAASDFESASAVAREAGDDQPLAALAFMAEHNRGFALYLSGDLPGALAAMSAAEELPADVFRGPSLFDRARVLHEAGLLDEAVEALDRARAACRPRLDQLLRAEVDLERARVLRLAGEFDEAAATARAARARYRRQGATSAGAAGWRTCSGARSPSKRPPSTSVTQSCGRAAAVWPRRPPSGSDGWNSPARCWGGTRKRPSGWWCGCATTTPSPSWSRRPDARRAGCWRPPPRRCGPARPRARPWTRGPRARCSPCGSPGSTSPGRSTAARPPCWPRWSAGRARGCPRSGHPPTAATPT
jgi:tetratricopeptide (TPR) repeat protein